ncbi:hypothetical protein RCL1_007591 [Eukaryota sp. TZLM3-RCL]
MVDIHYAAYALDPKNHQELLELDDVVILGLRNTLNKMLGNEDGLKAFREWNDFCEKRGFYSLVELFHETENTEASEWWRLNGSRNGFLRNIARKVLGLIVSTGAAERNVSSWSCIHQETQ